MTTTQPTSTLEASRLTIARRIALIALLASSVYTIYLFIQAAQIGTVERYRAAIMMAGLTVVSVVSVWLNRREQSTPAMLLLGGWLYILLLESPTRQAGQGIILGPIAIILSLLLSQALSNRWRSRVMIAGILVALAIVAIDALGPTDRPSFSPTAPLIVEVVALLTLLVTIIQQFRHYTLRNKINVALLIVTFVSMGLVAIMTILSTAQFLTTDANQVLLAAASQTAATLDTFIDTQLDAVRTEARLPILAKYLALPADQRAGSALEQETLATLQALGRKDRVYIASYNLLDSNGRDVLDTDSAEVGLIKADLDYFQQPRQTGLPFASAVTYSPTSNDMAIYFSAPVRSGGDDIVGVLSIRYRSQIIQRVAVRNNGLAGAQSFAIVLDENRVRLAAGTDPASIFKSIAPLSPEKIKQLQTQRRLPDLPASQLATNLPGFSRALDALTTEPFFAANLSDSSLAQNQLEQAAVAMLTKQPWLVIFAQPQAIFLSPIDAQSRATLLLVLLMVIGVAAPSYWLSQSLTNPFVQMTAAARQVQQGDFTVRMRVETQDEIGQLATTFNSMTEQLRTLVASLEDRVRARTEQLRASAEVSRATSSILDVDQLLREAVNLIADRFGFYYAAIFTLDNTGKSAMLREATGEAGRVLKEHSHQLAVTNLSMVGTAILTRRAHITLDSGPETARFANPLLPNTRSEIALPLMAGQRVIGALDVQSERANAFDEASADVLQTMADQLAVALVNAELFSQAERQARVMAVLNQLSRELAQATSLAEISTTTAKHIVELAQPNQLSLSLLTANPNQFMVYPLYLTADSALGQGQLVEISQTITGDSFRRGETVYTSDLNTLIDRFPLADTLYAEGSRAIITIPLRAGQRVLGTLNISSPQINGFSPEQIAQLEQVAAQLAVALQNYNLSEQTRATLQELDTANRRLIGQAWERYAQSSDTLAGEWREGQWLITPHNQQVPADNPQLRVPIKVRGETIGEFSVQTGDQRVWTSDDIAFAQALIDQVGQVIENARLLEETGRLAQREQRIRQITTRIRAASDVQAVLEATTTELAQSLGVSRAIMRLTMSDATPDGQPRTLTDTAA